jgi:hypothetical protein
MFRVTARRLVALVAVILGWGLAFGVQDARATLIDFATLPGSAPTVPGQSIINQYASLGVTFAVQSGASFSNAAISTFTCCGTPTPALTNSPDGHGAAGQSLDIFFSSFVNATFLYDNYGSDFTGNAFGCYASGTLVEIGAPTTASNGALEKEGCSEGVTEIRIFQPTDNPNWIFAVNDISFDNAVPEPGTLMVFGAGLLGLAVLRRRYA